MSGENRVLSELYRPLSESNRPLSELSRPLVGVEFCRVELRLRLAKAFANQQNDTLLAKAFAIRQAHHNLQHASQHAACNGDRNGAVSDLIFSYSERFRGTIFHRPLGEKWKVTLTVSIKSKLYPNRLSSSFS